MEPSRSATGQSSTYGQACTQCYKAKCRCVRTGDGDKCERSVSKIALFILNPETFFCRCLRLKKRCEPSESTRRRNAQTATASASDARIARLEETMGGLLSAMQILIGSPESLASYNMLQRLNGESQSSSASCSDRTLINTTSTNPSASEESTSALTSTAALSSSPHGLFPLSQSFSPPITAQNQGNERLNFFRSRMLPSFPFIDLRPDMTSSHLSQKRPFLLQAIHTVTTFSTKERLARVEELKRVLFTSAFLGVQSNIDLLLGALTYLAWSTDAFLGRADLMSRLMMLATSLACDLRLLKPSSLNTQLMMAITQGHADNSESPGDEDPYDLLEKQRAMLACFILSSKCVRSSSSSSKSFLT